MWDASFHRHKSFGYCDIVWLHCCVWVFLHMLQIHIPTVSAPYRENSSHTETRHFVHSPTRLGRGFKVSGKTLSRTHSCRITREVQRRSEGASQVSLQTWPSPAHVSFQARRCGCEALATSCHLRVGVEIQRVEAGWQLCVQEKGQETLGTPSQQ